MAMSCSAKASARAPQSSESTAPGTPVRSETPRVPLALSEQAVELCTAFTESGVPFLYTTLTPTCGERFPECDIAWSGTEFEVEIRLSPRGTHVCDRPQIQYSSCEFSVEVREHGPCRPDELPVIEANAEVSILINRGRRLALTTDATGRPANWECWSIETEGLDGSDPDRPDVPGCP